MTTVLLPESLEDLWDAMDTHPHARLFAGGTDLMVHVHQGRVKTTALIGLERVVAMRGIREDDAWVELGAATPLAQLIADSRIIRAFPVLVTAMKTIGGPAIRNMATLGGNLCTASPAGDSLPALTVLDAELVLRSRDVQRQLSVREFIQGPGRTALQAGEIVAAIRLRRDHGFTVQHFEKVGQRQAHAISIASLAVCATLSDDQTVRAIRCAWGSVGPTMVESDAVHAALLGRRLSAESLADAASAAMRDVKPIDDLRASAAYRRQIAGNLLFRLIA